MVRLLGKIKETAIQPTHDSIIRTGQILVGTGGVGGGATYALNTGFHSVISAFFTYNMKSPPGANATLGLAAGAPPVIYQSDTPTYGATVVIKYSTVTTGCATIDWFAIGDI